MRNKHTLYLFNKMLYIEYYISIDEDSKNEYISDYIVYNSKYEEIPESKLTKIEMLFIIEQCDEDFGNKRSNW